MLTIFYEVKRNLEKGHTRQINSNLGVIVCLQVNVTSNWRVTHRLVMVWEKSIRLVVVLRRIYSNMS